MSLAGSRAAGCLARVLCAPAFSPPSARAASPSRMDLFDPRGNRTGFAIVKGDRIDFFDGRSTRTDPGRVRDGAGETFDASRGWRSPEAMSGGARARRDQEKAEGHESRGVSYTTTGITAISGLRPPS